MHDHWPDNLTEWTEPPPGARAEGEVEPVRCFESAEAAMIFLARQSIATAPAARRTQRVLPALAS